MAREAAQAEINRRVKRSAEALKAETKQRLERQLDVCVLLENARILLSEALCDEDIRKFVFTEPWSRNTYHTLLSNKEILALWQSEGSRPFLLGLVRTEAGATLDFWEYGTTGVGVVLLIRVHEDALAYIPEEADAVLRELATLSGFLDALIKTQFLPF